jgi:hypothetical protein
MRRDCWRELSSAILLIHSCQCRTTGNSPASDNEGIAGGGQADEDFNPKPAYTPLDQLAAVSKLLHDSPSRGIFREETTRRVVQQSF